MSYNRVLQKIPVLVESREKPGNRLHWQRRAFQIGIVVLAVLIPASGLFRIDPVEGAFVVLDHQIWFSDFFIVFGLWITLASGLVMTYSAIGTAFCGWACPQNTMAEWANFINRKILGRRAGVSLDGEPMRPSAGKNKWLNWVVLIGLFLTVAMAAALIPMFYFYPPSVIWSFVTFQDDARLAGSMHWIYAMFVLILLVDIAVVRHFWCRFMCIYKVWQHSFKTRQTLHVVHDTSHADECSKCNYCVTSCFVDIDPRDTETYDACVNCGECINACGNIRAARNAGGSLLRFELGERDSQKGNRLISLGSLLGRVSYTLPLTILGLTMFTWGLWSYEPYHLAVYRADTAQGVQIHDYRIALAHKIYRPGTVTIHIEGLPEGTYSLNRQQVHLNSATRTDVQLRISENLEKGLYPFVVEARAADGWHSSFRVQHYATGEKL